MEELNVHFFFKGQDVTAHVTIYHPDKKKTLLCLHGLGSSGKESFEDFSIYFKDYRLVALDWVGYGGSSRLLGKEDDYGADYCTEWYTNFIHKAIDIGLFYDKYSIFAQSMSAIPVAKSYSSLESSIEKIIFANPAGMDRRISLALAIPLSSGVINKHVAKFLCKKPIWDTIRYVSHAVSKRNLGWEESKRKKLESDLKNRSSELDVLLRYSSNGFNFLGRMRDSHIIPQDFMRIKKPVLVLYSEQDDIFYQQQYLNFLKNEMNCLTKEVEGVTHNMVTQNPERVSEVIMDFLE